MTRRVIVCFLVFCVTVIFPCRYRLFAFNTNGWVISNNYTIKIHCKNSTYAAFVYQKAYTWNDCPEIYMYSTDVNSAQVLVDVSNQSTGNYGVTYHYTNNAHSVILYNSWISAGTIIKAETVVHEFGHVLGLAHTQTYNESNAVMRATGFNYLAYPLYDDKLGIASIY